MLILHNIKSHNHEETVCSKMLVPSDLIFFFFSLLFFYSNCASSPTKLLCFTRSSPLINQLPAQYPSSFVEA